MHPLLCGPVRAKLTGHHYLDQKQIAFQIEFYEGALEEFARGLASSDQFPSVLESLKQASLSDDSGRIPSA